MAAVLLGGLPACGQSDAEREAKKAKTEAKKKAEKAEDKVKKAADGF